MEPVKPSILIVDDERANVNILGAMLGNDYQISVAINGEQALNFVSKNHYLDLILLDVDMPGINGYQVCETLKANPLTKDIPIIFITAHNSEEDEAKGLELGAVDYITKPFRQQIVMVRLKNQLELKRQRDLLTHLSNYDGLTGIQNRNRFNSYLEDEWQRAIRMKTSLSLLLLDIDCFKQFNDNYGHVAGDVCLRKIAQSIAQTLKRSIDMTARYGGEEFACILPDTDHAGAMQLAEQIRQIIIELAIPHEYSRAEPYVTVSIGVAVILPSSKQSPLALIEAADSKLYQAKKAGRNCIKG